MFKYILKEMRLLQWAKGMFILIPLIFGRKLTDPQAVLRTICVLGVFNLAASAMYLINDVVDIDEDKKHPEKCRRPLASGKITVNQVITAAIILLIIVIPCSFMVDVKSGTIILLYLCLNYLYMRYLKHTVIIDVFCIGAFFYLRILAGSVACDVVLSNWIIICATLLALFLGFNKRKYDLEFSKNDREPLSKYNLSFLNHMISMIGASLARSYSLYAMDPVTVARYGTNHLLYSVPFVCYGLFRYYYVVDTKWFGGDPTEILIRDYTLQLSIILWLVVCVSVIYFKL